MKILIPIDNSECSLEALNSVLGSYWTFDSEFEVMTVVKPIVGHYSLDAGYLDSLYDAEQDAKREAGEFVDAKADDLKKKFPLSHVTAKVYIGEIADTILERAEKFNADLIVLGSHNRRGLNKFLLGSVAERVATNAQCSVEIVRTKSQSVPNAGSKVSQKSCTPA